MFGVFYEFAEATGVLAKTLVLVRAEDTVDDALLWLSRYAVYRSYGVLDHEQFSRLVSLLDTVRQNKDINTAISLGSVEYFVRELTEEELAMIGSEDVS